MRPPLAWWRAPWVWGVLAAALCVGRHRVLSPRLAELSPGWATDPAPQTIERGVAVPERFLGLFALGGTVLGWACVGAGAARFVQARRGGTERWAKGPVPLKAFPFSPRELRVVVGEVHGQEGERVAQPSWLVQGRDGLCTGTMVIGATGSGKTAAVQYPMLAQLVHVWADDPARRLGGLMFDPKGDMSDYLRTQLEKAGRGEDYYEISEDTDVSSNVLSRPDLLAPSLAGHFVDALRNAEGESGSDGNSAFWKNSAIDLAAQAIRIIRIADKGEASLRSLYRVGTSEKSFNHWLERAQEDGERNGIDPEELESLEFWHENKLKPMDPKTRSNIQATLNSTLAIFDEPKLRRIFAPTAEDLVGRRLFPGFQEALKRGLFVSVRLPDSKYKVVSRLIGTLMKLNFFDAVLQQLIGLKPGEKPRASIFCCDEYDSVLTQPGDGQTFAKARQAGLIALTAVQSLESLVLKLRDEHSTRQLLANFRTKIALTVGDEYTAKALSELCGEVDRRKSTYSRGENVSDAEFSWVDGQVVGEEGSANEGVSVTTHREPLFPAASFMSLREDQAIVRAFDGRNPLPATVCYLKRYYKDPDVSWFEEHPGESGSVRVQVVGEDRAVFVPA